jgi:hypothetical protein
MYGLVEKNVPPSFYLRVSLKQSYSSIKIDTCQSVLHREYYQKKSQDDPFQKTFPVRLLYIICTWYSNNN